MKRIEMRCPYITNELLIFLKENVNHFYSYETRNYFIDTTTSSWKEEKQYTFIVNLPIGMDDKFPLDIRNQLEVILRMIYNEKNPYCILYNITEWPYVVDAPINFNHYLTDI